MTGNTSCYCHHIEQNYHRTEPLPYSKALNGKQSIVENWKYIGALQAAKPTSIRVFCVINYI